MRGMGGWLGYVGFGVAWGLLCVGIRHMSLKAGMDIQEIVARRGGAVARNRRARSARLRVAEKP